MQLKPIIRKVRPHEVRYGPDIARGPWVWCAFDADKLVCVGATAREARRKYHAIWHKRWLAAAYARWGTGGT
jgi:hypothetical protein